MINFWLSLLNALSMFANLGFYAWGNHSPASLAIGISNGFIMLICWSAR